MAPLLFVSGKGRESGDFLLSGWMLQPSPFICRRAMTVSLCSSYCPYFALLLTFSSSDHLRKHKFAAPSFASVLPPALSPKGRNSSLSSTQFYHSHLVDETTKSGHYTLPTKSSEIPVNNDHIMASSTVETSKGGVAVAMVEEVEKNDDKVVVALKSTKIPKETFRKDYKAPDFLIDNVFLDFSLEEEATIVKAELKMRRRPNTPPSSLVLHGEDLKTLEVVVDGDILEQKTKKEDAIPPLDLSSANGVSTSTTDGNVDASHFKGTYYIDPDCHLHIGSSNLPAAADVAFTVKTTVKINPIKNTHLMGLYMSNGIFSTQCEAEGFRRITFFLDRPDVMSIYRVRIEADKAKHPRLLSNGNLIESGDVVNRKRKDTDMKEEEDGCAVKKNGVGVSRSNQDFCGTIATNNGDAASSSNGKDEVCIANGTEKRHYAIFEDPHPKPCYLFALVAGKLSSISDSYTTGMSKRKVKLEIFAGDKDKDKLQWAMDCVKKSMKWDEDRFGREYDLDVFNVVCLDDFNMGAMENKGLNIFNSALLLAHKDTTSDAEFQRILNVVGHEYFHNWTGNRVTCRDWFQLTLKEGLTVFRDQIFTEELCSPAVKRIEDVIGLRARQFAEDSGPMAHPIRPESYIAMDNFYTATVYDKGAEVIRMYHTLLGEKGFRKGMDLYFERHDRHAVTCDDFRAAMADANGKDLEQFSLWYSQAGTPIITVKQAEYQNDKKRFVLTLSQHTPPTAGQRWDKLPMHIPITVGLLGKESKADLLSSSSGVACSSNQGLKNSRVCELREKEQTFYFDGINEDCVLSILRGFSAPVSLVYEQQTDEDVAFIMANDSDSFNRWEAGQKLASKIIMQRAEKLVNHPMTMSKDWMGKDITKEADLEPLPKMFVDAFKTSLLCEKVDQALKSYTLRLPLLDVLSLDMKPVQPVALHLAILSVKREICDVLHSELKMMYDKLALPDGVEDTMELADINRRRLRNLVLSFLVMRRDKEAIELAYNHYKNATNMTDRSAGLNELSSMDCPESEEAFKDFKIFADDKTLVVNKWFILQALADRKDTMERVLELKKHPDFSLLNPNRFRSLVAAFARNAPHFHSPDGQGYKFVGDCVAEIDRLNPHVAARTCTYLIDWKKYDEKAGKMMKEQLERIKNIPGLSPDTLEIATKGLADE